MAKMQLMRAIIQALTEEMERDENIIVIGKDVEASSFGDTRDLLEKFGPDRVKSTPTSKASLTDFALSAAATGYRVVLHMTSADFIHTGFDAIANQMAELNFMTDGQSILPITIILNCDGDRSTLVRHSNALFSTLMNLAGVEIVVPSNSENAKGLMKGAIRSNNPTFFLEPGGRGSDMGEVPDTDYVTPLGQASLIGKGTDLTLITMGSMTRMTVQTAQRLQNQGVSIEVLDLQTLVPLDETAILRSASKTGRVIIVDESRDRCSAASHIAAIIAERGFSSLRAPVRRITVPDTAMPYASSLKNPLMPNPERILSAASDLLGKELT